MSSNVKIAASMVLRKMKSGNGVTSQTSANSYAISDNSTKVPTSWSATLPDVSKYPGQYFWTRTTITFGYNDGTTKTSYNYSASYISRDGSTGLSILREDWTIGREYRNDASNTGLAVRYQYWVHLPGTPATQWYIAKAAHNGVLSAESNKPGTTEGGKYWEEMSNMKPIYTPALFAHAITAENINTDGLVVNSLRTAGSGPRILMHGSMMEVYGNSAVANIRNGVDETTGVAILCYYDNDGRKLYDLGPDGVTKCDMGVDSWESYVVKYLGNQISQIMQTTQPYKDITDGESDVATVYQFHSKYYANVVDDPANDKKWFVSKSKTSAKLNGWYTSPLIFDNAGNAVSEQIPLEYNGALATSDDLFGLRSDNEPVYKKEYVYMMSMDHYVNGEVDAGAIAYWNVLRDDIPF